MPQPIEDLWIAEVTNSDERYAPSTFALRAATEEEARTLLAILVKTIGRVEDGELTSSLNQARLTEQVTQLT